MYKHHRDSINNLINLYKEDEHVIALFLGGSLAKGMEKETSDIDAMVILSDEKYEIYSQEGKLSECISDYCTYDGGYFDIKYFNKDYLVQAARKGSEPTRNSFIDVKSVLKRY